MRRASSPSPLPEHRRSRALGVLAAVGLVTAALAAVSPSAQAAPAPHAAAPASVLGPNVHVFTPDMPQSEIQSTVDAIAAQQVTNQFGTQRYALLFAPGTYGSVADPLHVEVGYYTEVAGLGRNPGDVVINGSIEAHNQCGDTGCLALNNFWRTLSNLTVHVVKTDGGCDGTAMFWATSQAASMRRVAVDGPLSLMDYCTGPSYASGGFIADSRFSSSVTNGSQQQFVVRNSSLNGWSNGVWNQVFVGTAGAPAEEFGPGTNQYTTVASTPVQQEEPYLVSDPVSGLRVFVPSSATGTTGPSWGDTPTPGTSLPLSAFEIATPAESAKQLDKALSKGKNLLLTPGVYHLDKALHVTHPGTVVMGLGLATLVPTRGNAAITVDGVAGTKLSGLILDAGPVRSRALLVMQPSLYRRAGQPSLIQDVYLRVGGATPGRVTTAADIAASDVVIDNMWAWRADHGAGVGWTDNTATTGLKVTGRDVVAYGLFVEHFQGDEVVWNGPDGRVYMFQNEMPYDVPSQQAWMTSKTVKGHAALSVGKQGDGFQGYGLGSYSFFNQGLDIHASRAFTIARGVDATIHHALTVFLDGSGGIDSVVDGRGAPVTVATQGTPSDVTDVP